MTENQLSEKIIGCAIQVHKSLGPGLLESAYEECLFYELKQLGLFVEKQKPLPLIYKDVKLEALNDVHIAQMITYLKLSGCKLGLLINFNVLRLVDGLKRIANNL